jgi:hypothetical protein
MTITTIVSGGPGRFVVLVRTIYIDVPPRVDYALIPLGRRVAEAIVPRFTWGTENSAEMVIGERRSYLPEHSSRTSKRTPVGAGLYPGLLVRASHP